MSDLLTEENATQVAEPEKKVTEPTTVVDESGSGKTDSMLPAYLAGASKEQKEAWVKDGVKFPEKFTEFLDGHMQLEANARSSVIVPSKDAPKEQWDAYREKMGIPSSPDGYTFDRPQLPEGMAYNDSLESWFKQTAHELNIPAGAAKEMFSRWNQMQIDQFNTQSKTAQEAQQKQIEEHNQAVAAARTQLQSDWGENFSERLQGANQAFLNDNIVPAALREKIKEHGLQNDTNLVRLMDLAARATRADSRLGINLEGGEPEATGGIDYGGRFKKRYAKK